MLVTNYTPEQIFDGDSPPVYCRWVAAWNPVLFSYTRQDHQVSGVTDSAGNARIEMTIAPSVRPVAGDKVYVFVPDRLDGVYTVLSSPTTTSIVISASSFGSVVTTGYVNLLTTRPNYYITLTIRDENNALVSAIKYTPLSNGLIEADIAGILQSKLSNDSDYILTEDFPDANQLNPNAFFKFKVSTKEFWTGSSESEVNNGNDWFAVNGAFQVGNVYNGNYRQFLIGETILPGKFLSPFAVPTVYPNYPYHLSFIWDAAALPSALNVATFTNYTSNINETPPNSKSTGLVALNSDGEGSINTFLFSLGGISSVDNRVSVYVWLQLTDNTRITEQRKVKVRPIDQQSCYGTFLRWLAPDGSYGFYLFEGNYRETMQVDSNGTYQQAFNRIDNLKGFSRYLKKTGFKKRQIGMTGLDKNDADGIETMLYSPMVYLITPNATTGFYDEVQVLIEPGTFAIKQAKQNLFDVEFSFVYPEIFNQGA